MADLLSLWPDISTCCAQSENLWPPLSVPCTATRAGCCDSDRVWKRPWKAADSCACSSTQLETLRVLGCCDLQIVRFLPDGGRTEQFSELWSSANLETVKTQAPRRVHLLYPRC